MNNIIRKIKDLYPVSDNALKALTDNFEQVCFPAESRIISAGTFDRNVYFIESGITRSYILIHSFFFGCHATVIEQNTGGKTFLTQGKSLSAFSCYFCKRIQFFMYENGI